MKSTLNQTYFFLIVSMFIFFVTFCQKLHFFAPLSATTHRYTHSHRQMLILFSCFFCGWFVCKFYDDDDVMFIFTKLFFFLLLLFISYRAVVVAVFVLLFIHSLQCSSSNCTIYEPSFLIIFCFWLELKITYFLQLLFITFILDFCKQYSQKIIFVFLLFFFLLLLQILINCV